MAGLDRPGLLDLYDRHVRDHIEPIATRLQAEIATANGPGIVAIWSNDAVRWLNPGRPSRHSPTTPSIITSRFLNGGDGASVYEDQFEAFAVWCDWRQLKSLSR